MNALIEVAWKVSVLLLVAAIAVRFFRKSSAAVRHLIWATAVLSAVALPIISRVLPSWSSSNPNIRVAGTLAQNRVADVVAVLPAMAVDAVSGTSHSAEWLLWIWAVGCCSGISVLLLGSARLAWQASRAKPVLSSEWMWLSADLSSRFNLRHPVRLLISNKPVMPVTWGILHPTVLLPVEALTWSAERCRVVLSHELAHVKRRDWLVQIVAEVGRAVYWFNPLVWIGCNRLREESEHACDDAVLASGIHAPDYAEHLLDLARNLGSSERAWSVALAMARTPHLEMRFIAMLNPTLNRARATRATALLTTLAAVALLLPLAALRSPAQSIAGNFSGMVYDPSGAAVPNAIVIASNLDLHSKDMTSSTAAGFYEFAALQAGTYSIEVLKPGFAKSTGTVKLGSNQVQNHNVTLNVGEVNEQLDVIEQGSPAPSNPPGRPQRIRVGGNVQATKIIDRQRPIYPQAAKAAHIQGSVLFGALIGLDGSLTSLHVVSTQADPELVKAAVDAVSHWRYQPTLLNGLPIEVATRIVINFTLTP